MGRFAKYKCKMGNLKNVNLPAIKTSVSLSECRVQGGLACKGRHMGGNSIYQHLSTQSDPILSNHITNLKLTLKLETLRTFTDFYSAGPSLKALHQFGSTVKISDLQEIAHSSENF